MIQAASFMQQARELGFDLFTGVPCSYLKPFINYTIDAPELAYIGAANEGDAVAIASGSELAGRRSVVMFQNSGFGNTVNPLTSLNAIFRIPVLLIVTWRGEPDGKPDEPQHELMGQITAELFDTMRLPYALFPQEEAEIAPVLHRAVVEMERTGLPFGLIMQHGAVADHSLKTTPQPRLVKSNVLPAPNWPAQLPSRLEVLRTVQATTHATDAVIATTGFTGRALYALEDRPNQLYLVGSMGCAGTLGLGVAVTQPQRRVIVLDGDGAALMRLSALPTIGYERPANLVHILLDNEIHESTGGQATVSHSVDLAAVAQACGYPRVLRVGTLNELAAAMDEAGEELTFIHVKTAPGGTKDLPRPTVKPYEVAARFRAWLRDTA
ncbi:MAG TPA: phosphonopyruvate decarboxylase [Blastocatellia bacterium]|nr:phosphonopyruvate decarboxylase [Blastocatellia bacterium]